jgi:hypothetical protein
LDKAQRHALARAYADPVTPGTRWTEAEQLFIGLGGYAKWSDKEHLTVELWDHKQSFQTPRNKSADLDAADGKNVREFLSSCRVAEDMAKG